MITLTFFVWLPTQAQVHQTTQIKNINVSTFTDLQHFVMIFFIHFLKLVNVGEDCPVFDGLYQFCQISTGGSVGMLLIYVTYSSILIHIYLTFV